jgi:lysophospholipase L1-like esterase
MRIAFYGDSLTEGWPGAAFMPLLERRLPRHTLVNRGRAGDTTRDLLLRLRRDGLEQADLAVVWIGTNDAFMPAGEGPFWDGGEWLSAGEPPPSWSAVLASSAHDYDLVLELVSGVTPRLLLAPPVVPDPTLGRPWTSRLADVAGLVEAAACRRPAAFCDLRQAFSGAGPFTIDGIHLNEAGAAVVASSFATAIENEEREAQG